MKCLYIALALVCSYTVSAAVATSEEMGTLKDSSLPIENKAVPTDSEKGFSVPEPNTGLGLLFGCGLLLLRRRLF